MEWIKDKDRRTGLIVTILVHAVLVLILSFLVMQPPFPPPPQLGVEVNLGNSNDGMGDIQPEKPAEKASNPKLSSERIENIATQSTEESINIKKTKKTEKVEIKDPEPVINQTFQFKKKNNQTGGNQGTTGKPGDQGAENGNPNSDNYSGGGSGNGISFQLTDRKAKTLVKPEKVPNQEGRIVIQIKVDKNGKVTDATLVVNKSTNTNNVLVNRAINSALASQFDTKPDAPEKQVGYITYVFTY